MILAIVGPTGVGKTKLSVELAKKYKAIIINSDAMQVYKELQKDLLIMEQFLVWVQQSGEIYL